MSLIVVAHYMTGASCCRNTSNDRLVNFELKILLWSVLKIQRWWRSFLELKLRIRSAIIIQSHFRGWTARKIATRERHRIRVIQVRLKPSPLCFTKIIYLRCYWICIYAATLMFYSEIMSSIIVIFFWEEKVPFSWCLCLKDIFVYLNGAWFFCFTTQ